MTTATAPVLSLHPPANETCDVPPGLSPQHLAQLDQARGRRKKIDRALWTAGFSAWSLAVFAVLSLPFVLLALDWQGGLVVAGLMFIACREFTGRHKLKQLQASAARHLGCNQLLLCGLIALYAGWQIVNTLTGPSSYTQAIAATPELASTLEPLEELKAFVTLAMYSAVLVIGLLTQGSLALYYFTRKKHIRSYLDETPQWVVEVQRRG